MQPIRASHRISRTKEGEVAWRTQALDPALRSLLGLLRNAQTVSDILRPGHWSPNDLEGALNKLARSGWVLIQEPETTQDMLPRESQEEEDPLEDDASALAALLSRRSEEEVATDAPESTDPVEPSTIAVPTASPASISPPVAHVVVPPAAPLMPVREIDNIEELPFDPGSADDDGLMQALRNPEESADTHEHVPEWAPPSGGLAALLRALGETVPDGVDLSPDQHEHLRGLDPVEPWGGPHVPSKESAPEKEATSFARLRDQPSSDKRQKARLGSLHESLGKVQREQSEANAVRDRARKAREERDAELRRVQAEQAARRKQEERGREASTLIGLSQKLARVKNKENND